MKHFRTIITLILLSGIFFAYYYDVPKYWVHFIVGVSLLLFELFDFNYFKHWLYEGGFIKVKSNVWTESVITTAVVLYFFSDQPMNIWNIIGISALLISGISKIIRCTSAYYRANAEGIWKLHTNTKFISSEKINSLRITDEELSIDTTKYQNDFQVKLG